MTKPDDTTLNKVTIRENSWIAMLAAKKLKAQSAAIVLGNTIHLYHSSKKDFLLNESWVKHELCHVAQFRQYGYLPFIAMYLLESIKRGYYENKYEVAAHSAENL